MALTDKAPKAPLIPEPKNDVEIVFEAIGPNPVFFDHLLSKPEADLEHAVHGMNEDQLKAVDRLRSIAEKDAEDKDGIVRTFADLCNG